MTHHASTDELTPTMRTGRLRAPGARTGPRENYTRAEFHLEVETRHGTVATARFLPEYGNTWACQVNLGGEYRTGRGTYPGSAFNDAVSGRLGKLAGEIAVVATDIDGEEFQAVGATVGQAIENVYALMIEQRGIARMRRS